MKNKYIEEFLKLHQRSSDLDNYKDGIQDFIPSNENAHALEKIKDDGSYLYYNSDNLYDDVATYANYLRHKAIKEEMKKYIPQSDSSLTSMLLGGALGGVTGALAGGTLSGALAGGYLANMGFGNNHKPYLGIGIGGALGAGLGALAGNNIYKHTVLKDKYADARAEAGTDLLVKLLADKDFSDYYLTKESSSLTDKKEKEKNKKGYNSLGLGVVVSQNSNDDMLIGDQVNKTIEAAGNNLYEKVYDQELAEVDTPILGGLAGAALGAAGGASAGLVGNKAFKGNEDLVPAGAIAGGALGLLLGLCIKSEPKNYIKNIQNFEKYNSPNTDTGRTRKQKLKDAYNDLEDIRNPADYYPEYGMWLPLDTDFDDAIEQNPNVRGLLAGEIENLRGIQQFKTLMNEPGTSVYNFLNNIPNKNAKKI